MVRAPAHALTRSTGFALLKPASRPQLDSARIITLSGTIALNMLAMGLLMMPMSMPPPAAWSEPEPITTLRPIPKDPPVVEVVEIVKQRTPVKTKSHDERQVVAQRPSESVSTVIVTESGTEFTTDASSETTGPAESLDIVQAGPSPMQLQYKLAPAPVYPRRALHQRLAGTVLLQVLVGIDGRPLEVKVAQSSGHRELDEAARAQVLKRWSFQPATRDGLAVQAIGMVPIEFELKN